MAFAPFRFQVVVFCSLNIAKQPIVYYWMFFDGQISSFSATKTLQLSTVSGICLSVKKRTVDNDGGRLLNKKTAPFPCEKWHCHMEITLTFGELESFTSTNTTVFLTLAFSAVTS